jgi:hypothetical protein
VRECMTPGPARGGYADRRMGNLRGTFGVGVSAVCMLLAEGRAAAAPTTSLVNPLVAPSECAQCHEFINPLEIDQEPPVSSMLVWRGTMMANAARDPVFWAAVAVASQDAAADATGLLEGATEHCIRCHAPRAFLEGNTEAIALEDLTETQREGIDCELCHRMTDDPDTPAGNAGYVIDDVMVGGNVPRRGPWSYDPDAPESARPEHSTIADPFTGTSRLCGTCHDVTTPKERVDEAGDPMGMQFNEQRTYSEWLGSAFADGGEHHRECQSCHMPAVSDAAGCEPFYEAGDPALLHPTGARRHDLVGANRFMLERLRDLYGQDEVPAEHFDITIARTDEFLGRSADLEMALPEVVDIREGFALDVTVINKTGHKLPTGYSEGRVAWIEVTVGHRDELLFSSGLWEASQRQEDDQLRTYEAIAEDHTDGTHNHLLRNDRWVVDDRIPPLGLRPDPQTDPVGDRYALLEDGTWPNFDTASYGFGGRNDVVDATPEDDFDFLDVRVRLLYLINTPEYIEQLRDDNLTNDAGEQVWTLFAEAGGATPVVLGEAATKVAVIGLVGQPEPSEGTGTTTDMDPGTSSGMQQREEADGCGCRSIPAMDAWWALLLVVGSARRRRARAPIVRD